MSDTTTVYVLGTCPVKGCKNRKRIVVENAPIRTTRYYTYTDWKIPAAAPYGEVHAHLGAKSDKHSGWGTNPRPSAYLANNGHTYDRTWFAAVEAIGWICTDHDRFMVTTEIKGVVNVDKSCNGHCMNATGPNCECSCGGTNHGGKW